MKVFSRSGRAGIVLLLVGALLLLGFFLFLAKTFSPVTPILMYHEISSEMPKGPFVVSEKSFSRQMTYLAQHGYQVISLDELVSSLGENKPMKSKRVVLTFDDGTASHFRVVYPILKRFGFTATFFIVPTFVWKPGYLTWKEAKDIAEYGFTIGSHSLTHRNLVSLSPKEYEEEIILSKAILEKQLGRRVDFFCYPGGFVNVAVREKVKNAGFRGACALQPWHHFPPKDPYTLHRVWMTERASHPFTLWWKVHGYDPWLEAIRNVFRISPKIS